MTRFAEGKPIGSAKKFVAALDDERAMDLAGKVVSEGFVLAVCSFHIGDVVLQMPYFRRQLRWALHSRWLLGSLPGSTTEMQRRTMTSGQRKRHTGSEWMNDLLSVKR